MCGGRGGDNGAPPLRPFVCCGGSEMSPEILMYFRRCPTGDQGILVAAQGSFKGAQGSPRKLQGLSSPACLAPSVCADLEMKSYSRKALPKSSGYQPYPVCRGGGGAIRPQGGAPPPFGALGPPRRRPPPTHRVSACVCGLVSRLVGWLGMYTSACPPSMSPETLSFWWQI